MTDLPTDAIERCIEHPAYGGREDISSARAQLAALRAKVAELEAHVDVYRKAIDIALDEISHDARCSGKKSIAYNGDCECGVLSLRIVLNSALQQESR